jgi:signal transduction histidine kinase
VSAPGAGRARRWHAAHRRWRHSLQWRLVTVFLALALATTGVFVAGSQQALRTGWQGWVQPIVADYLDRLAAEIGSPPDPARAAALAARLPITIRIDGPQVRYDSRPARPHAGRERRRGADAAGTAGAHDDETSSFERLSADGHRIRFGLAGPSPEMRPRLLGWITLAGLLLLTLAAFAAVRRLLRPLGAIGDGVARFGRGDFGLPITVRRDDEFGDLAGRINRMAASLHDRLEAKRALLLAISHELRSPLTRARLHAELVADGPHRDALLRDLGEMRDLIADLLESERLAAGHAALHTEALELAAFVRDTVAAVAAGRAIELDLDTTLGTQRVDPARLRLVLRNLVDNALRHGGDAAAPPRVTLARGADGRALLTVRDHGPGVADEALVHLAEPFYRTDAARTRASGGVGLGLALCRLVAQAHGGELLFANARPGLSVTMAWPVEG